MKRKRDEPAYPAVANAYQHPGLTKLEATAIQLHAALLANPQSWENRSEELARMALEEANALWDELEKETSE